MDKEIRRCSLVLGALLLLSFVPGHPGLCASDVPVQEIRIRVVDGRNGRPVTKECINVWVSSMPTVPAPLLIATDKDGVALLRLVGSDSDTSNGRPSSACHGMGVIDPAVKYGDTIVISTDDYVDCRPYTYNQSPLHHPYPVKHILEQGIELPNSCGKIEVPVRPGDLILFVRPMHWWEGFSL